MEPLEHIQWQYFCCVPIGEIDWKNFFDDPLTWSEQEALLNHTIDNEIITNNNRHLPKSYSLAFFRSIISKLESNNTEDIHDKFYEHYVQLLNDSKNDEKNHNDDNNYNSFAYRHFKIQDLPKSVGFISIKESQQIISNGTTGLRSWHAASALAEFAIKNIEIFQNKCILELGAGTGLAGLVIAKCCQPKQVIMTDGNIEVMKLLESNIECNFPVKTQQITSEFLDWDMVDNLMNISEFHKPDLLVAADVIYDPDLFEPLLNVIKYFFEYCENACRLIMACTERNVETLCQFTEKLENNIFTILYHDTITPKHLYWDNSTPIKIFSCFK